MDFDIEIQKQRLFLKMILLNLVGYLLLFLANVSSSVSMNFQKLAQHQTLYHDPRRCTTRRTVPLNSCVCGRPLFIISLCLSATASIIDFVVLAWLSPATVGVFGCLSIVVNLFVSQKILYETLTWEEKKAVMLILIGCLIAMVSKIDHYITDPIPYLLQQQQSLIYITFTWFTCLIIFVILLWSELEILCKIPPKIHRFLYPFIAGMIGSQVVCTGKYLSYAVQQAFVHNYVRIDVLVCITIMCICSIVLHVFWLNKALALYDASYCIMLYQVTWFINTVIMGFVVFAEKQSVWAITWFFVGCTIALIGVWSLSTLRQTSNN